MNATNTNFEPGYNATHANATNTNFEAGYHARPTHTKFEVGYITQLVLCFFGNFELMKFCQHFGETFSETFGKYWESFVTPFSPPPPPSKIYREKLYIYTALCKIYFLPKL